MDHAAELFNLSADLLCVADMDGYFRFLNPAFERVLGYSLDELKQKPFVEFVHPDDRPATLAEIEKLKTGIVTLHFENRYRCKDGTYKWLQWTSRPDTERGLLFAVARDATECKEREERLHRAEVALRKSRDDLENKYEAAMRASGQLLYEWDPRTDAVSYGNAERALGYTDAELEGGLERWVEIVHPGDREAFLREIDRVVRARAPFNLEYRVLRKDGTFIHVEDRGYFFFHADGNIDRMVGFVIDITVRKELEEQLRQAQKMEALGQLAGGVAHDFNNLLTMIVGYSALALKNLPEDHALRADLEHIGDAGRRAAGLTRQLLAFSRKQILQPQILSLNDVVEEMDRLLRRVIGEDIDLRTLLAPNLGLVSIDPNQTEQIVLNLAINARDAMPGGGKLTIETANVDLDGEYIRTHAGAQPGPHVMLAVSDTGVGMEATTMARIFEPFYTTKGPGKGTGLGLAMVFGIVKQSGGNIWVYSEPGRGTTFKVYLPSAGEGLSREEPQRPRKTAALSRGTETILVVEDEDGVRRFVERALATEGYTVLSAPDANRALAVSGEYGGVIDLLLTDVVMPGMGGRQLACALVERRPTLKVVYMSGYTDNAIAHHGVLEAGTHFIEKPLTPVALRQKLREVLCEPGN